MKSCSISQIKNESGILDHWMNVIGGLVDHIIIINDNSVDDSKQICYNNKHKDKLIWLEWNKNTREEGELFRLCKEKAKELKCERIYISDPDEIPSPDAVGFIKGALSNSNYSYRLHRAELAFDQKTVYGRKDGNGKLVIVNTDDAQFNDNVIHSSQPETLESPLIVSPDICLLHYGTSDYAYQVFKCLCYIVWENQSIEKSYDQGHREYFKTYRNFVRHGDEDAGQFINDGARFPYKHWLPNDIRDFCNTIYADSEFDIIKTIEKFKAIPGVKEMVFERV